MFVSIFRFSLSIFLLSLSFWRFLARRSLPVALAQGGLGVFIYPPARLLSLLLHYPWLYYPTLISLAFLKDISKTLPVRNYVFVVGLSL